MAFVDKVDPELAASLAAFPSEGIIDWQDLRATRASLAQLFTDMATAPPASTPFVTEDRLAPGPAESPDVPVRVYRPAGPPGLLPGLLWIHGGGMVIGSVAGSDLELRQLLEAVGCVIVAVEYRLAPEHPFPAPLEDCYAALRWMFAHAAELGIDAHRLAVGGGSAGGGLAAAVALLARDRDEVPLVFQWLIYPMLDDRNITPSSQAITDSPIWNRAANLHGWRAYLGTAPGGSGVSPYAAPARAEDLSGLPPAYIMVGTQDLFLDEDIAYAQRLIAAGVPVELHVYPGAYHGSEMFAPTAALSRRMVADEQAALKRGLRC